MFSKIFKTVLVQSVYYVDKPPVIQPKELEENKEEGKSDEEENFMDKVDEQMKSKNKDEDTRFAFKFHKEPIFA
jgi:hypothetical protein